MDHPWNSEPEIGDFLAFLIKTQQCKNVLELGVFSGFTSMSIINALPKEGSYTGIDITSEYLSSEFIERKNSDKRVNFIQDDCLKVLNGLQNNHFDLIFIDTTHTEEQTRAEFKACEKLIKQNGFICLHDSISHIGVTNWINYIKKFNWFEVLTINTSRNNGLSIVKCLSKK